MSKLNKETSKLNTIERMMAFYEYAKVKEKENPGDRFWLETADGVHGLIGDMIRDIGKEYE